MAPAFYNDPMSSFEKPANINLFGSVADSIVDGPGLRFAVFVQGCTHGCLGCHNPESWSACGGTPTPIADIVEQVRANGLITGVTLSGGEPFEQPGACSCLAAQLKTAGYDIWTYTGYLYEDLLAFANASAQEAFSHPLAAFAANPEAAQAAVRGLLQNTDVLVDGPFVQAEKSLGLKYRGSSNQRLIDLPATYAAGCVVEWRAAEVFPSKPASW